MEFSETMDAALRREVLEETGFLVHPIRLAGTTEWEMPKGHVVALYFHTAPEIRAVVLSGEHDDFSWAQPTEMHGLNLHPEMRDFLREHRGA